MENDIFPVTHIYRTFLSLVVYIIAVDVYIESSFVFDL